MIKPIIRAATAADLPHCLSFDPSYETDYVWQMDNHPQAGHINISFRTVRLPRPMKVAYPRDAKQLNAGWNACDAMLVADDNRAVVGYAALARRGAQAAAWVQDLIVTKTGAAQRRRQRAADRRRALGARRETGVDHDRSADQELSGHSILPEAWVQLLRVQRSFFCQSRYRGVLCQGSPLESNVKLGVMR